MTVVVDDRSGTRLVADPDDVGGCVDLDVQGVGELLCPAGITTAVTGDQSDRGTWLVVRIRPDGPDDQLWIDWIAHGIDR
ncbi:hypothetical protein [Nocardia caishijiensis]|uniref:hypothetical protein n=1 Tax=Nocardia caishijiensis TaxID=184756 RepID=UPI001428C25A|nr:hypothetical protein [Nocardia caishijiensis]